MPHFAACRTRGESAIGRRIAPGRNRRAEPLVSQQFRQDRPPARRSSIFRGAVRAAAAVLFAFVAVAALVLSGPARATAPQFTFVLDKFEKNGKTTFSAEGEVFDFVYRLSFTSVPSNYYLLSPYVNDDHVAVITCPSSIVASGGSIDCTGTYTITAADMAAGTVTNDAVACGSTSNETGPAGALPQTAAACFGFEQSSNHDQWTLTRATAGAITLAKSASPTTYSAAGQVISYAYLVTNGGSATLTGAITVTDDRTTVTCPPNPGLAPGASLTCSATYMITAADVTAGSVTNVAVAHAGSLDSNSATATVNAVVDPSQITQQYIVNQIATILQSEPDRWRYVRKFDGSLWGEDGEDGAGNGGITAYAPADFSMAGSGASGRFAFSTSLQQIQSYLAASDAEERARAERGDPYVVLADYFDPPPQRTPLDVWVEGHYSFLSQVAGGPRNIGQLGVVYFGADYMVRRGLVFGVMGQVDSMTQTMAAPAGTVSGTGWMAGPYVTARLLPNLFFDARLAWGQSSNVLTATGIPGDVFGTNRFLARANLTGNWRRGPWRITPTASLAYMTETQLPFTSSTGLAVPAQTVSFGQFTFGPEFARRFLAADGTSIEPMLSLAGVWDFARSGVLPGAITPPALRARLELGLMVSRPSGVSARVSANLEGLGSPGYLSVGARFWLSVPIH